MKRLVLILGLVLLFALAACNGGQPETQELLPTESAPADASGETAPPVDEGGGEAGGTSLAGEPMVPELTGVVWEWVDTTTPVETITAVDPLRYTIQFNDDGTANITADCNSVLASYVADETGALSITLGPSTMVACPEDTQDQQFLTALASAAGYFAIDTGTDLYIDQAADAGTMRFRMGGDTGQTEGAAGAMVTELTGATWEWVSVIDPMGQTAVNDPTRYTITFNEDGTATVKADCNNVVAGYSTDASNIAIEVGATTLAACPEDSQDQLFTSSLAAAAAYFIQDGELFIDMEADAGTLIFRPAGSAEAEAPEGPAAAPVLTGVTWEWVSTTTPVETITATDPTRYTITFNEDGTAGVKADCNSVGATYTAGDDSTLTIALGPSTLVGCPPDSQATPFLAGLAGAAVYSFDGNDLLIDQMADAGTLRFRVAGGEAGQTEGQPETAAPALTGTVWEWVSTVTPVETITAADPTRYTIEFMEDGTASIKADCNQATATYTEDGSSIAITLGASTLALCPEDSQDAVFLAGLGAAAVYFFQENGHLFIDQFASAGTMEFQPAGGAVSAGGAGESGSSAGEPGESGSSAGEPGKGEGLPPAGTLTEPLWQWTGITRADGNLTVNDPSRYTIRFNDDGTAALQADCNSGSGTFTTGDNNALTITPGALTRAFCGPGSLDQIFLGGLTNAMSYRIESGNLIIDMLYESGSLTFISAQQ